MLDCTVRGELVRLCGLSMDPAKRLHILQVRMLRALMRKRHILIAADLGDEHDGADLFDLRVFRRRDAVHVACNLDAQV